MATDAGILIVEATTGEQRVVPWPPELVGPLDTRPAVRWRPGDLGCAPIPDASSVYSDNGHLTALGFLDEETVLLLVTPALE